MTSFGTLLIRQNPHRQTLKLSVFVTGNANKLREVKAILAAGDSSIEVTSQAVDGMFIVLSMTFYMLAMDI